MIRPVLFLAGLVLSLACHGQGKTVRIVVPAAAGGPTDVIARLLAPALSRNLGQPVIVENRGGAGGILGTDAVAKSLPDGTTLGLVFMSHATNPAMNAKLPYDTLADFAPITQVGFQPLMLVVNPSVPVESVKDLIALAKAKPGALNYGADTASAAHLAGELFKSMAAVEIVHISYRGNGPALIDVLGGQVPFMFNTVNTSLPHIKVGRLKALATTGRHRSSLVPEVPTMAESGMPGFEVTAWYGLVAPAATPKETLLRLNRAAVNALASPDLRQRMMAQGVEPVGDSAADFDAFLRTEIEKWGKIVRAAKITS